MTLTLTQAFNKLQFQVELNKTLTLVIKDQDWQLAKSQGIDFTTFLLSVIANL